MAFPVVAATNSGNSGGNTTSHTINLPTGIAAGDLLIVEFSCDGSTTFTWPAGWTQLYIDTSSSSLRHEVRYIVADGSEGSTITVTSAASEGSSHVTRRITGTSGTIQSGTSQNSFSTNPNPPSLTPAWGAQDTLWIVMTGWDGNTSVSAYPTNYGSNQVTNRWANNQGTGVASATRELNATSEDPGTFTIAAGNVWAANTVAVQPAGAASFTLTPNAVVASFDIGQPSLVLGATTLSPNAAEATFAIGQPSVNVGAVTLTPNASRAIFSIGQPTTVVGVVTLLPSFSIARFLIGVPTVSLSGGSEFTLTPSAARAIFAIGQPIVNVGAFLLTPSAAIGRFVVGAVTTTVGATSLLVNAVRARFLIGEPTVVGGDSGSGSIFRRLINILRITNITKLN